MNETDDAFQILLRKTLAGRLTFLAKKALDRVEKTLDDGTPALRFKAATWLLERHDKLSAVGGMDAEQQESATPEARVRILLDRMRSEKGLPPKDVPDQTPVQRAAMATVSAWPAAEEELIDAELHARPK